MKKRLELFIAYPENNLKEVMQKIDQNGYGIALVVNEEKKLLGIVTDGDIRRAIINGIWLETKIEKIMNISPVCFKESTDARELLDLVTDQKINRLPVLDEEGILLDLLIGEEVKETLFRKAFEPSQNKLGAKQKHILVIGGAGYIGSVLVGLLLERGHKVKALDKLVFGRKAFSHLEKKENFSFIEGDICHIETVIEAIKDVDAVVQLAEIVGDPACAADPQKTQQVNHLSTLALAHACKYFQVNRFIYASSCSVYGASQNEELLMETSELNPVSLYARMKIESEKVILGLAEGTFSPTILRFATVFGESPRMRFDLVVNTLTAKAVHEGKITIFGGDQWRPFVHVSDVAKAIALVLESPLQKVNGEVFNVGSNENNFKIDEVGKLVKEIIPSAELVLEDKEVDKRNYRVDFSKIKKTLGFEASKSVSEGIKEISLSLQSGKYDNYLEDIYYNHKVYQKANF